MYCGLGSVAFQGEMVAIAAELKKGSGTTACQGVPFDLICFELKSSSLELIFDNQLFIAGAI